MHLAKQIVLSLEFSTQHRKQLILEKRVKELEHDKESLQSDFEAAQGSVDLMRGMVEKARGEYLAQVQETIKTAILMGQAVNSLDCEVVAEQGDPPGGRDLLPTPTELTTSGGARVYQGNDRYWGEEA